MSKPRINNEHSFSLELKSKEYLKRFTILNGVGNCILVEGFLGELQQITFVDGLVLEVLCSKGVLRMEIKENDLKRALAAKPSTKVG